MRLSKEQLADLYAALLSAFPNRGALQKMVLFHMGENLEVITLGDNLSEDIVNLIIWAQAQERLADLIAAARADNPGNRELRAFAGVLNAVDAIQDTSKVYEWAIRTQPELLAVLEQILRYGLVIEAQKDTARISQVQVQCNDIIQQLKELINANPESIKDLNTLLEALSNASAVLLTLQVPGMLDEQQRLQFHEQLLVFAWYLTLVIRSLTSLAATLA